ncbi:MAG: methylenetetrahydrofolate reductase [NAD(P)H] [Solirubrobacterales bacterium]
MRIDEILARPEPCFSVEFFPPKTEEGRATLFETVEVLGELDPAYFSVTYGAGGTTREGTVETARTIRDGYGVEAMAHLSCVGETVDGLRGFLDTVSEAGIGNVLALRGDPPAGEGAFEPHPEGLASAAELAALIGREYPQMAIGASSHPEVHPEAADLDADLAYLKTKVGAGASFLITQLFFDNRDYFAFVTAARAAGIEVPIIAGLMPITSYEQIVRFCKICQATIPAPLAAAMEALGGDKTAEFELGVAWAAAQSAELMRGGAPGIHFYALNRYPATRAVLSMLRATRPWKQAEALNQAAAPAS